MDNDLSSTDEDLTDDPFAAFSEWQGQADDHAYREL
jgi:hypothetical protein